MSNPSQMNSALIDDLAARLRNAYGAGPIAPLRPELDPVDQAGAYAVQARNTGIWLAEGRRIVGRKIGLTALAVQKQLGVDQPDFGVLFQDMQIEDGGLLKPSQAIQPKAEAEIAIVLAKDLQDVDTSREAVHEAAAYAVPAIEIVDSRIQDWRITFADTVADNASSAFFVLGSTRSPLDGLDLVNCKMRLDINGETASTGVGSACLGHPLEAAAWLARTMARLGDPLRAGDVLLTGALGPMVPLVPGATVKAVIEGVGQVGFRYMEGGQ